MVQNKSNKMGQKKGQHWIKGKKKAGLGFKKDGPGFKKDGPGFKNGPGLKKDGPGFKKDRKGGPSKKPAAKEEELSDFEEVGTSFAGAKKLEQPRGFEDDSDDELSKAGNMQKLVQQQNRKKKKSGGFQAMGLSKNVFLGVTRKGYKVPTPIQRKTIPLIMDGKDVVAMARTGSGKTAAFLVPMLERLKVHSTQGARAMIMSPTRELALQTLKFAKELGKYTNLKCAVILGGDSMENQFAALHENPDIIIATPGRFMHVVVEMNLKLHTIEYVVFDEADRLFEMGFQEQLTEVLKRLPEARQTLLFSATLPKLLVEFAQAGLHDPTLLRLDVDTKLSPNLQMSFLSVRPVDRLAVLLYLLKNVIKRKQQTVVFAATKHHVEYLHMVLKEAGIDSSYTFSALDPTARKINVAKFQHKKTSVLIVTDLAARGIDIPLLDTVINYNFPAKSKLFVHRVGRVARAGNSGNAFSLVGPDELPFVLDLHLFLGRSLKVAKLGQESEDGLIGRVPQRIMDDEEERIRQIHSLHDIQSMTKVIDNAYRKYIQSRPAPSSESIKRSKDYNLSAIAPHPIFGEERDPSEEEARSMLLERMKAYRPNTTIFEINSTNKTKAFEVMKVKRNYHDNTIHTKVAKDKEVDHQNEAESTKKQSLLEGTDDVSTEELKQVFSRVVAPKRPANDKVFEAKAKKRKRDIQKRKETPKRKEKPKIDEENYLHYKPKDFQSEKGLSLGSSFESEAAKAVMDLSGMDSTKNKNDNSQMRWDRKKKKFVNESSERNGNGKKWVKTESGVWIPASYKTNMYKDWLNKSKKGDQNTGGDSDDDSTPVAKQQTSGRFEVIGGHHRRGKGFHQVKEKKGGTRPEIKRKEQILKARKTRAKELHVQQKRNAKRSKRGPMKH